MQALHCAKFGIATQRHLNDPFWNLINLFYVCSVCFTSIILFYSIFLMYSLMQELTWFRYYASFKQNVQQATLKVEADLHSPWRFQSYLMFFMIVVTVN